MSTNGSKLDQMIKTADGVINSCAGIRVDGKVASIRTKDASREQARENCRRLHKLGYYLTDVNGMGKKHIDALVQDWYNGDKLSVKTIQNQFSRVKIFCGWIGKDGIISPQGAIGHLPGVEAAELKVSTVAKKSKSWSANGIDVQQKIREAIANDVRHGAMLLMAVAFGLRKKEQLKIQLLKADKGTHLEIDGSVGKNGKFRAIPIEHGTGELAEFGIGQRWALNEAKKVCKRNETLGWPELTYKQSENRYYGYMRKLGLTKFDEGVTAHGLRAEYAENTLILRGLMPPSLGGHESQMPKGERDNILQEAANRLGHDNLHTSPAYVATFRNSYTAGNLGGKVGRVIVVDSEKNHFAVLYANPLPKPDVDGTYAKLPATAMSRTVITVVLETPARPDEKLSLQDFVKANPGLASRVKAQLGACGLGPQ